MRVFSFKSTFDVRPLSQLSRRTNPTYECAIPTESEMNKNNKKGVNEEKKNNTMVNNKW